MGSGFFPGGAKVGLEESSRMHVVSLAQWEERNENGKVHWSLSLALATHIVPVFE